MAGEPLIPRIGTPENPIRIAVLFSGSGTGMNALFQHQENQSCTHKTVLSITNKSDAGGIMFANERGIPVVIETIDPKLARQERRVEQERRIMKHLEQYDVEVIILSGYMQILSEEFQNTSRIRVNCINPGTVRTKMRELAYPAENPEVNPLAADIMKYYLYLMSDQSLKISGQTIDAQER